jgi:bifunctional oligoribonuclease and PAP phosphatase NrnA
MQSLEQVAGEIKGLTRVAIVSHVAPDGDCIGSMVALGSALQGLGVDITLINTDAIPDYLGFLPLTGQVIKPSEVRDWPETIICVDCSDEARLGEAMLPFLSGKTIINIDHHISNDEYGTFNYVDPGAAATGQIITQLLDLLEVKLDKNISTALYTALVTDTGSFQYSNTDASTHLMAARLINTGIDVAEISRKLYDTKELPAVRLLGKALDTLELSTDGRLAWISIPRVMLMELGAKDEHAEGVIGFTRALSTVEVGMLFREFSPGRIKVGFRSKQFVDVNKLAAVFGGGGHARASGCIVEASLEEAIAKVVNTAQQFIEGHDARNN